MSKKTEFKLDRDGVAALMKSDEMQKILNEHASDIASRCGDGFKQDLHIGRYRANAMVRAFSRKAKKRNLEENTLLKAVRG